MDLLRTHPILEETLDAWRDALGGARVGYGNHAYRVFNYARRLLGTDVHDDTLAIASAFHDLGIWSDGTFDYLPPSITRAREYANARGLGAEAEAIARLIDHHHCLLRVRGVPDAAALEAFRRADLADVSAGLVRGRLERAFVRETVSAFPYSGFHGILVKTALSWLPRHPLHPFPMLRLRAPRA